MGGVAGAHRRRPSVLLSAPTPAGAAWIVGMAVAAAQENEKKSVGGRRRQDMGALGKESVGAQGRGGSGGRATRKKRDREGYDRPKTSSGKRKWRQGGPGRESRTCERWHVRGMLTPPPRRGGRHDAASHRDAPPWSVPSPHPHAAVLSATGPSCIPVFPYHPPCRRLPPMPHMGRSLWTRGGRQRYCQQCLGTTRQRVRGHPAHGRRRRSSPLASTADEPRRRVARGTGRPLDGRHTPIARRPLRRGGEWRLQRHNAALRRFGGEHRWLPLRTAFRVSWGAVLRLAVHGGHRHARCAGRVERGAARGGGTPRRCWRRGGEALCSAKTTRRC